MSDTASTTTRPVALVTGASSGIGRALARQFAAHGYDLVLAAEDDELQEAGAELRSGGTVVHLVQEDLATTDGVQRLHEALRTIPQPVAAAALNAGVGVGGRFAETDLESDLRLVDLNVRSTVHLAKLLVRDMVGRGEGRLLFTSSIASTAPDPFHATCAASKAFVQSFAQAIRHELLDTGVTVTSMLPGPTETELFERADMEDTRMGAGAKDEADEVARHGYEAMVSGKADVAALSSLRG